MSDPKRYELYVDASLQAEEGGEWVKWDDYAELQSQVERLTKAVMHSPAAQLKLKELEGKTTFEEINPKEADEVTRLKAEVERLTKELENTDCMFAMASAFARDWNAAKENHPHA